MKPLLVSLVILTSGALLSAHHSTSMFDMAHPVTLTGTVVSFEWVNPHSYIHLDVKGDGGALDRWDVETHSISLLAAQGVGAHIVQAG